MNNENGTGLVAGGRRKTQHNNFWPTTISDQPKRIVIIMVITLIGRPTLITKTTFITINNINTKLIILKLLIENNKELGL
jgi:hypothetical protein